MAPEQLEQDAPDDALYTALPSPALKAKNYDAWSEAVRDVVAVESIARRAAARRPTVLCGRMSPNAISVHVFSRSHARLAIAAQRIAPEIRAAPGGLEDKFRRAQQAVEKESQQATGQKCRRPPSRLATLVGALFGRKDDHGQRTIGKATAVPPALAGR